VRTDAPAKCLIELPSGDALTGLQNQLQTYCNSICRPVFYIHSPDDLICQAPFVRLKELNGSVGEPCQGPGGALYNFLQRPCTPDNPPILIVNYSNFSADDIVRFNALLDNERFADGVAVPKDAKIIGLVNTQNPNRYTGSDFYSRFALAVETCPVDLSRLEEAITTPFIEETAADAETTHINLYLASDWKERLLGRWILQGNELCFEEGELPQALASGKPIILENAPVDDPDFQHFWQQAVVHQRIDYARGALSFPLTTAIGLKQGYNWEALLQNTSIDTSLAQDGIVCNPQTVPELFRRYECRDSSLYTSPGLLEVHEGRELHLNITRALSDDAWAECLSNAQKRRIRLHLHVPSEDLVPDFFSSHKKSALPLEPAISSATSSNLTSALYPEWSPDALPPTTLIASTDPDATIAKLTQKDGSWTVLDISECTANDLLTSLNGRFDKETLRFLFSEKTCALIRALEQNKSVLLTGTFSPELADELAKLILARRLDGSPGRLLIVSDNPKTFAFAPQTKHTVAVEEKRELLGLTDEELSTLGGLSALDLTPFAKLKARRDFIRNHPGEPSDKAWEGLETLPGKIYLTPFNAKESRAQSEAFHTSRLRAVEKVLRHAPFVFLTGLTGVGKTTFIREHLAKNYSVHQGEEALASWIADSNEGFKILFIDEANLELRQWSQFEGLFYQPPTLLVNGELITLSAQHRVVFAGNPVSYGDDRRLASLFARHGNALVFEPLPPASIYEEILKPVFSNSLREADIIRLCQPLLDVYQYLCQLSTEEVLITPRELQMMALLLVNSPHEPSIERANELVHEIASHALPAAHRKDFGQRFPKPSARNNTYSRLGHHFLITPSRQPAATLMQNMLALRHARLTQNDLNDAQKYGGLGGIVFEGEPGVGKSDFVRQFLLAQNYRHQELNTDAFPSGNLYCEIPVSMGLEEKKQALMKAFHAGAVVIIDEINSSPMMEKLLNGLLMGIGPKGERPDNPGFMIIGTQNPVTMAGRQAQSGALARRMVTLTLPEYPNDELQQILQAATGVEASDAMDMVQAFTKQSAFAKAHNLKPAPCFRDLINLAKCEAKALDCSPDNSQREPYPPLELRSLAQAPGNPAVSTSDRPEREFLPERSSLLAEKAPEPKKSAVNRACGFFHNPIIPMAIGAGLGLATGIASVTLGALLFTGIIAALPNVVIGLLICTTVLAVALVAKGIYDAAKQTSAPQLN
jgi:hypothetical protein